MSTHRQRRRSDGWLRLVAILVMSALLGLCDLRAIAADAQAAHWEPQLSPRGPVVVVVSLPAQRAEVYRNGIRIGASPVSTGRPGYETPPGIYTILQKEREHYSNLYDDAPMPYMQRLTWDGVALHAGVVPGHPASHGCIRLPAPFAAALFEITSRTSAVVVTPDPQPPSILVPIPLAGGTAGGDAGAPGWQPQVAGDGPVSLLLSTSARVLVVLRNGVEIGRLPVEAGEAPLPRGTIAYVLQEGTLPYPSPIAPDRPARPWLSLPLGDAPAVPMPRDASAANRLRVPAEIATSLYDLLAPGTVLVITDEPLPPAPVLHSRSSDGEPASHPGTAPR